MLALFPPCDTACAFVIAGLIAALFAPKALKSETTDAASAKSSRNVLHAVLFVLFITLVMYGLLGIGLATGLVNFY